MIHSHEINSVAISILDVSSLSMHNYNPPTYDETTKVCGSRDLEKGQILVQRPHGAGMPFVHQVFSYNDPLAFWLIEISLKALDGPAPRIRTPESPGVQTQHHPPSDFWSAVTLTLQPGAQICLSTESAVTPLVRSIHRIDDPLNDISVDVQGDVACVRRETQMWKWLMQAIVISNLQKNTLSLISNRGSRPWTGVVLDVFGKS